VDLLDLTAPLFAFAANLALQLALRRSRNAGGRAAAEARGFVAGLLALTALSALGWGGAAGAVVALGVVVANGLIYVGLAYGFFHFVNLAVTARRVRLVRELRSHPDGLTLQQLLERYSAADMIELRLGRLLATGQIAERAGRYHLQGRSITTISRIMIGLKLLLLGRRTVDL